MTTQAFNTADELRRIIAEGRISEDALEAITGIPVDRLRSFLDDARLGTTGPTTESQALSGDESARLSVLVAQLTEGLQIGDDQRLKAVLESLTIECHLTLQNIARLTALDLQVVELALSDPRTIPADKKYELAIRGSYLINAISRAHDL